MNGRFVTISDIRQSENDTAIASQKNIGPWLKLFDESVNLILKFSYFFKADESVTATTPTSLFFSFAYNKYLEAPHSLNECNSMMIRGKYLNAMIQLRSLFDYFVSCRYFHKNLEHISPYINKEKCVIKGEKKWLGTSEIYCHFSEKFYKEYYGNLLSNLEHGKAGEAFYRVDGSDLQNPRIILMPEFNLGHAFAIINHLIPIIYGYLYHFDIFFKNSLKEIPSEFEVERFDIMKHLKDLHTQRSSKDPIWFNEINLVIGISI